MKKILLCFSLGTLTGCYHQAATITGLEGKSMPSFNLLLSDSSTWLNTNSIPTGKPVVLCYFGTHCPYSRAEMQDIINNIDDLKDIRLYVITPDFFPAMKGFYEHFELNKYNNIAMGFDNTGFFRSYFQVKGVPYIAIYNKNKKLSRVFIGKTDVAVIKDIAAE